jgi:hypothetical protein
MLVFMRALRVLAPFFLLLSSACIIIPIPSGGGSSPPRDSPVVLRNDCEKTVFVVVGDRPPPDAPKTALAPKAKTSIARRHDGTATVWLFDETGAIVGSATTSADARKAAIEKGCTTVAED